ncbi:MAG: T9SS type A sorting domain-containing protein, partial [Nitrososphaera sp.]|nr:T9SS type A sorting domain-containing protein [Nitrososphaera sp.]
DHPKQLKLVVGRAEFVAASLAAVKIIPASYELSQNFPNPFNPATTIRYGLPKAERVRVTIYNLLGEEVVTLVEDEPKEAGYHAAIWAGRNQHAQPVASGIYLYRLRAGSFMMTKKMVLVQ